MRVRGDPILQIDNLVVEYGKDVVLRGIDLSLLQGEVLALLGPNGAGKTTTIKSILGLLKPASGRIYISGKQLNVGAEHALLGVGWVPQQPVTDPLISGREALSLFGNLYGINAHVLKEKILYFVDRLGLAHAIDYPIQYYSGGTRKKLEIAIALLHDPHLLILDEPTTGLDVSTRIALWNIIRELRSLGKSILLTTHYLDEADALADRIAFLNNGEIQALGTSEELKKKYGWSRIRMLWSHPVSKKLFLEIAKIFPSAIMASDTEVELRTCRSQEAIERINKHIEGGVLPRPAEIEVSPPNLEQAFMRITGSVFDPITGQPLETGAQEGRLPNCNDAAHSEGSPHQSVSEIAKVAQSSRDEAPANTQAHSRNYRVGFLKATLLHALRWYWHTKRDTINKLASFAQPVFWFLLFSSIWSNAVSPSWAPEGYMSFMTGGAIILTVFNLALMSGVDILFDRERGSFQRFLTVPAPKSAILAGKLLFTVLFAVIQSGLAIATAALLGVRFALGFAGIVGLLVVSVLVATGVGALSLYAAFALKSHPSFFTLTSFISLPAIFISAIFVPIHTLPPIFQPAALANPLSYGADLARYFVTGSSALGIMLPILVLLLFNITVLIGIFNKINNYHE